MACNLGLIIISPDGDKITRNRPFRMVNSRRFDSRETDHPSTVCRRCKKAFETKRCMKISDQEAPEAQSLSLSSFDHFPELLHRDIVERKRERERKTGRIKVPNVLEKTETTKDHLQSELQISFRIFK